MYRLSLFRLADTSFLSHNPYGYNPDSALLASVKNQNSKMSSGARSQREKVYERLKRKLVRFSPRREYGLALERAATEVLEENLIGSEEEGDQVGESIKTMLPPAQTVFKSEISINLSFLFPS